MCTVRKSCGRRRACGEYDNIHERARRELTGLRVDGDVSELRAGGKSFGLHGFLYSAWS